MGNKKVEVRGTDVEFALEASRRFPEHSREVFTAALTARLVANLGAEATLREEQRAATPKPMAATEFFAQLKLDQDVDKVLAAAYFLEKYRKSSAFTAGDVKKCLVEAKVSPPSNISLAVLRNARKGHVGQTGEKQAKKISWFLTQTGIGAVEAWVRGERGGQGK